MGCNSRAAACNFLHASASHCTRRPPAAARDLLRIGKRLSAGIVVLNEPARGRCPREPAANANGDSPFRPLFFGRWLPADNTNGEPPSRASRSAGGDSRGQRERGTTTGTPSAGRGRRFFRSGCEPDGVSPPGCSHRHYRLPRQPHAHPTPAQPTCQLAIATSPAHARWPYLCAHEPDRLPTSRTYATQAVTAPSRTAWR